MNVKSIVVEQLDWDGTSKSLTLEPNHNGRLWVAFPSDYEETRTGPFYFQHQGYQKQFDKGFAECKARRITQANFFKEDNVYTYKSTWQGIPTEKMSMSYYALYLPEFAVPFKLNILDPYKKGKQFKRTVIKDKQRPRFIIYLQCASQYGAFSFNLECQFKRDETGFEEKTYLDEYQQDFYAQPDEWKNFMDEKDKEQTNIFFAGQTIINNGTFNQTNMDNIKINNKVNNGNKKNNPWLSGSFYLFVFVVIMTFFSVASNYVHWAALPITFVAGILSIGIVGALQLRNDEKLKEENFVKLMIETYRRLPFLKSLNK
jgi:hypothetical protein